MAGNVPISEPMTLSAGADFLHEVHPPASVDLPSGTEAWYEILKTNATSASVEYTWDAAYIDSRIVRFRVESDDADLVPHGWHYRLMVRFPEDPEDQDHCWFVGPIFRKQ